MKVDVTFQRDVKQTNGHDNDAVALLEYCPQMAKGLRAKFGNDRLYQVHLMQYTISARPTHAPYRRCAAQCGITASGAGA